MDIPKYDGNIHPDEWINDIQKYLKLRYTGDNYLNIAISLVDSNIISLPTNIDSFEELRNTLKEDISFTVFKCTNKRLLELLKYIPEKEGGNTSKFISDFRKLCYNSEINDIREQKNYFCNTLPKLPNKNDTDCYNYLLEFIKRREKIKSMNDLVKEFVEIITVELNLIKNGSIVALKHVVTGKYLSSIENLRYTTGSMNQLVYLFIHFFLLHQ
uniref:MIR domain-containing protein n=2 Tax=Rhizophagus irregularis (strain DAOM 181602 / DAOM 197198 / MUCL 43194) TaxID=747089 RepID=U9UG73_RHIID